ncbi:CDP-glycerol glycerophosphotransferase family protein [Glycomyces harbinensis]|uniref:CDP-Glycerol:Poly(Glycerophosphate) glycerophosphotransferase n=1 Tax=Glycomyces harbinensis TaxID=58114 RepID=A0A1G6UY18_9ACTN|nr:CDP-glycerol glycerophosphotransferase family protein [Glycomyces harbinensis]SDD46202.1 CDP-Glycerol:Poly(glycerophosphate) glycerophosphotransferase [Glycomyces harbinensis]
MTRLWRQRYEVIALAAVIAAAIAPTPLIAYALAAFVLAVTAWSYRDDQATVRTAKLLAVLAVLVAAWSGETPLWTLTAACVLAAGFLAVAGAVRIALGLSHLETVNLVVHRSFAQRAAEPKLIISATGAAATLLPFAAAVPEPMRPVTDAAALGIMLAVLLWTAVAVLANLRRRRVESHPIDEDVVAAVEALQPRFVVHFGGARFSEYQIQMWLPYFDQIGDPYLVLVRDAHLMKGTAACTSAPIVLAPGQNVLDKLLPQSVRACFYSNHAQKNTALIRHGELLHIQLMHGDSDKAISRSALSLMYDRVFVAGQAGVDRYHRHGVDLPEHKFRLIGRPQLHGIRVGERERAEGEAPVVLYAPTWTGFTEDVNYSSLEEGRTIVQAVLAREASVIFRTHPYTRTNAAYQAHAEEIRAILAADAASTGRPHRWGPAAEQELSLVDCINAADVAVSDISGAASDWLYSGRPFAMTDPKGLREDYLEEFPVAEGAYLLEPGAANIEAVLDEMLVTDSKAVRRQATREYYLGDHAPGDLFEVFAGAVRETYAEPVRKEVAALVGEPVQAA